MSGHLKPVRSSSSFLLRVCLDPPELSAPVLGEHPRPVVNRAQRLAVRSIHRSPAVAPYRDEPDATQHLQMFRDRRLAHLERVGDLVDGPFIGGNQFQDVPAARFGNRIERIGRRRRARHGLVIYSYIGICQAALESSDSRYSPARARSAMSFYERGPVRIHYEEAGSGFPLLLIAGGGLNSTIAGLQRGDPFNPIAEFKGEYRCIAADLRNANDGESAGPLEVERPWDAYTDDHLGLMDHLRIDKFMVMGFCIGGPFIWNLLKRAPDRIVAAVLAQPSGSRPEMLDLFYETNMKGWGPALTARRPEITAEMVDTFLTRMYRNKPDFVFTVTRDFVRSCRTPLLILPDDIPAHPYAVAMEAAMLAPNAEVSMFPWKEPKERIPLAIRQIRSFLRAHRPVAA